MKHKLLLFVLILFSVFGYAQDLNETTFDFWVGDWELSWDKGDGTKGHGINKIEKTLDGKVIQENFQDPETGFKGTSISVFNAKTKQWHQAWADNQGGYFDFSGDMSDSGPVFKTKMIEQGGKKIMQKMTFKTISKDAFTWDWEGTNDGGKTWKLLWRIEYKRKTN